MPYFGIIHILKMKSLNEAELVDRLKSGKEEAYIHLVDRYNQILYSYALSLSGEAPMAQDIVQNVFLKSWEHRKKLTIKSSLKNYLLRSVRNEFLNLYKKRRSTMLLEQEYFESLKRVVSKYDEGSLNQALQKINSEIQKLPPKCREVFLLSRQDGLTNVEISDYLKISTKTVEAHISKAFSILKKALNDKLEIFLFLLFHHQWTPLEQRIKFSGY